MEVQRLGSARGGIFKGGARFLQSHPQFGHRLIHMLGFPWFRNRTTGLSRNAKELEEWLKLLSRLESLELRQEDLFQRFNRFQNREGMRSAREAKGISDQELLEQTQALLRKGNKSEAPQDASSRSDLWSRIIE